MENQASPIHFNTFTAILCDVTIFGTSSLIIAQL